MLGVPSVASGLSVCAGCCWAKVPFEDGMEGRIELSDSLKPERESDKEEVPDVETELAPEFDIEGVGLCGALPLCL